MTDPKTDEAKETARADAAAKARAASLVGHVISGRYRIVELLAMGGMGAVYRGEHLRMRKRIAIKVLHPDIEGRPELVARFEREAIAGAQLSHANSAAATDFGELEDGSTFLVLEYVAGRTLRDVIDHDTPLAPARAAHIARQLASVLDATHAAGIVHRDVKPRNVMLVDGTDDHVKLIDFGLAKIEVDRLSAEAVDERGRRATGPLTGQGVLLGTVAYLAPEAALGMGHVDASSDLYALGLILYEMLSGKHPFDAKQPGALFRQHRFEPPIPIGMRAPGVDVPPALEAIAMRLLAKHKRDRFASGADVVKALDEAMAGEASPKPVSADVRRAAPRSTSRERSAAEGSASVRMSKTPAQARTRTALFAIAAVVLAVVGLVVTQRPSGRAGSDAPRATGAPPPTPRTDVAPSPVAAPARDDPAVEKPAPNAPAVAPPSDVEIRAARATLQASVEAKDWGAAERALLVLADGQPSALRDAAMAQAARAVATALEREGNGRADRVFDALSSRFGAPGLDLLYDLVVSRGGSVAAKRAVALLGKPDVLARATPALRIAFELREAHCNEMPPLFDRAIKDGDGRALLVLESLGRSCLGKDKKLDHAIKAMRSRLNQPPAP